MATVLEYWLFYQHLCSHCGLREDPPKTARGLILRTSLLLSSLTDGFQVDLGDGRTTFQAKRCLTLGIKPAVGGTGTRSTDTVLQKLFLLGKNTPVDIVFPNPHELECPSAYRSRLLGMSFQRYQRETCYMQPLGVADFANLLLRDCPEEALERMERATNCKDLVNTLHKHTHPAVKHCLGKQVAKPVMLAALDQKWETQSIVTLVYTLLLQAIPFDSFQRLFHAVQFLGLCDSDMECKKPGPSVPPSVFDTVEKSGLVRFLKILGNLSGYLHNDIRVQGRNVNKIHLSRCVGEELIELIIATQNFKTEESDCCRSLDHVADTLERGIEENKLRVNPKFIECLRFDFCSTNARKTEEGRPPIFCLTRTNNAADLSEIMTCLSSRNNDSADDAGSPDDDEQGQHQGEIDAVSEESTVEPSKADNSEDAANTGPRARHHLRQKRKPPPPCHQTEEDEAISGNQRGLVVDGEMAQLWDAGADAIADMSTSQPAVESFFRFVCACLD